MAHTVLVTGGAGFIGSHLVEALVARGERVRVLDSFDDFYDPAAKERNLAAVAGRVELLRADLLDPVAVARAVEGVGCVVHLAARAGVRRSLLDPVPYMQVNVAGTQVLMQAMRVAGVRHLVAASSSSVYGARTRGPFRESDPLGVAASPYAASKQAMEAVCRTWQRLYGCDLTLLRFFTVYGPRQRPDMAIHGFARKIQAGQPITMFGDGGSLRDYTFVGDIVRGLLAAVDTPLPGEVLNLGNTRPVRLDTLIACLGRALGREVKVEQAGEQAGDVPLTWADVSRARELLGYAPTTDLEEGLAAFVRWLETA
ncbi:MAG: NAD-dependent epimerase/dehydratase family protein [Pseudomonadota bacterium]